MSDLERVLGKVSDLKGKGKAADELVNELKKVKDKLPKEAKDALDKHNGGKKK